MKTKTRTDRHKPGDKWAFNASVTAVFDDMLKRSIPQHDAMRSVVSSLTNLFAKPGSDIVDIGCSRGEVLARILPLRKSCILWGLEVSPPMVKACQARFARYLNDGSVKIVEHDILHGLPPVHASVITAVLTIQFTPIEERLHIIADAYNRLLPGGALIVVEKVLGATALLDRSFITEYYNLKAANGYSRDAIERKRLALRGVLVPVTAHMNEEFLRSAGFTHIDCFWRWLNFAGWIAVKNNT